MKHTRILGQDASVLKEKIKPGTTKRILKFAVPYRGILSFFFVIVIIDAVVGIANPLLYRTIINDGVLGGNTRIVVEMAILAASLTIAGSGLGLWQSYLSSKIGNKVVLSMRTKLFEHIQRMPLAFFTRVQTGALVSRLNNDVNGAQGAFTDIISNVAGNIITVVFVLAAMFTLSWQITLAYCILLPFLILPARFLGRKLQPITRESYDLSGIMNNMMVERFNVAGAQLAKLFGRREEEKEKFEEKAARVSAINVKRTVYGRLFFSALTLMSSLIIALVYGWGGILAVKHVLDVGTLVALVAYLSRLFMPLTGLSNIQVSIMTALVSFERVFEVFDLAPMIEEKENAVTIPAGGAKIEFENVSFRYPMPSEVSLASLESVAIPDKTPQKTVLHNITFDVKPGELVALVGPSGAGKTTITQLIPRLYDPNEGTIFINGIDLRDAKIDSITKRIGVVTQEAYLFHDSIRANLLYAKPDATDQELKEALRAAQILPLIESLPLGLDTLVGERGYRFSGGEKQRLSIARLLLKAPDIIILDEATAHLDSESEAAIQKAFDIALKGRTSIVIAHRLSTIINADQILIIDKGRIIERGKHAKLLENGGLYADLFHRQFNKPEKVA